MKLKTIFKLALSALALVAFPMLSVASITLALVTPSGVALGVLNPASIAWNGKEVQAMNEAIFEPIFVNPPINDFCTILPGIVAKQQIAYLGLLSMVGRSGSGCNPESDSPTAPLTEKFWMPSPVTSRIEECYTTYNASFFVWAQNKGVKRADLTNTDVFNFITERFTVALDEAKLRHAWFGDTDAANYNSSPAGKVKNGVSLDLVNAIDGFWKQVFDIVGTTPEIKTAAITKNTGGTYALQKFDGTDTTNKVVMGYLQSCINDADTRLSDSPDAFFIVTKTVYDQYLKELKSFSNTEAAFQLNKDGVKELTYDGIPVRKFSFLDRTIKAIFDNGTVTYLPHRILFTTKANLQIGVESEEAFGSMDSFYYQKGKTNIMDSEWLMDAKVIQDFLLTTCY